VSKRAGRPRCDASSIRTALHADCYNPQPYAMGKIRDRERTRARILDAAAREFVEHGFDGTALAAIAHRARVSKQLIIHHFASKEGLFHAVLDIKFRAALDKSDSPLDDPCDVAAERFRRRAHHLDYIRFLTWEAASGRTSAIPAQAIRQQRVSEFGASLRNMQARGQLPPELDHALLQLAILALTTYPMAFAQVTQLVTGRLPTDPKFQRDWYDFLRRIGQRLFRAAPPAAKSVTVRRTRAASAARKKTARSSSPSAARNRKPR